VSEYNQGRQALRSTIFSAVRAALHVEPEEEDPQLMLGNRPAVETGEDHFVPIDIPADGISVINDPSDGTAWLVIVKVPRHTLTDSEAMELSRLTDVGVIGKSKNGGK
jgi:hypothetical protein